MDEIVGIDLGTTNSLIGVMEAGFPILLADEEGERLTPSVVFFPDKGEPRIGRTAQRMRVRAPERTVYSAKRFIGLRGGDLSEKADDVAYQIQAEPGRPLSVRMGDAMVSFEKVSSFVLQKLKADAARALGREVHRAVITVPAYFNDAQRAATRRAGELAGLTVERIINEPTAAALAYGLDKLKSRATIAVYDLGGGTFDISLLELNEGLFEVVATNGNTRLGGDDIDRALLDWACGQIQSPMSVETVERLREALVQAKHRLSSADSASIDLPFANGAESLSLTITRVDLENVARPIVERTRAHCRRVLADAKLDPAKLDEVILVGGVTRMPIVRALVKEIFGREPNISQNPDEAVALGATIQAGILSGAVRDIVLLDVTPLSLGIETFGGLMNVIIPRNSTIPVKAGEMFTTAVSNQGAMTIKVLQGEREMARDNWKLGEFQIDFERAPKGIPRVGVQFEIDVNGILHVLARDTKTGREKIVELKSAVDVSDEAVESMLAESLDHALADVNERVLTQTRLKSEEMLSALASALALAGGQLSSDEREEIARAESELQSALLSDNLSQIKSANESLDQATQHLAALVVEKAMAESGASQR